MCAMSMVMQRHIDHYDTFGSLSFRQLLEEYIRARKEDIAEGNSECEHQDKVQRIQQITGVNLTKI